MSAVTTVLLDLDGTLVDTAPDLGHALNALRAELGLPPLLASELRPAVASGTDALLATALPGAGEARRQALRERFLERYGHCLAQASRPFPGMVEVLEALAAAGITWGVVTNKHERFARPLLAALGLAPACLVCGDTLAVAKPDPEPLLHALALAGARPSEAVYVGDAAGDVTAAARAGIPALVAGWGYLPAGTDPGAWGAAAVLDCPAELLAWLRR